VLGRDRSACPTSLTIHYNGQCFLISADEVMLRVALNEAEQFFVKNHGF
jgi:hypothetical protein